MMLETARAVAGAAAFFRSKSHLLHVLRGTPMAEEYLAGRVSDDGDGGIL